MDTAVCAPRAHNPIVFMDIAIAGRPAGRFVIELRADIAPHAAENFRVLITGERGISAANKVPLCYRGTLFHRIEPDGAIYGGDVEKGDGTGRVSGLTAEALFPDENFTLRHTGPGVLSCCNSGPDTNCSLFMVTLVDMPWLDGKQVVFGVLIGEESYKALDAVRRSGGDEGGRPKHPVLVYDCGQLYPSVISKKHADSRPGTASSTSSC
ncbi:cyclophilin-like domain-containing protein [Tribonema minus]|uniref:Peptidyl-prolyl cis-trans isomerase n=1 Tax=Tribonema minus TaxID=303371 RepID=A0A835YME2_9STRA|nr:cyclophilin-like domain-containing protein [Tribonema minus]